VAVKRWCARRLPGAATTWRLKDLEHLYAFITGPLAELKVDSVGTVLIGHAVKRPGRGAL
jgi:hypothetical protein